MARKLFVGSLADSITDEKLAEAFTAAGTVESAKVIINRDSGQSKGFGFVEMSTDEEAQTAIKTLNGQELEGRQLAVSIARPMPERSNRPTFNRGPRY
jgi:cold-inducible RNA-binding protein